MIESILTPSIIGLFGILITIIFNNFNRKLSKDKMNKELFTEFNARYDKLNDSLNKIVYEYKKIEDIEKNPELKNDLIDYFNLCAEEYYWYKKERIDSLVWEAWSDGMNDWYEHDIIKKAWDKEIEKFGCRSYYIKNKHDFFNTKKAER